MTFPHDREPTPPHAYPDQPGEHPPDGQLPTNYRQPEQDERLEREQLYRERRNAENANRGLLLGILVTSLLGLGLIAWYVLTQRTEPNVQPVIIPQEASPSPASPPPAPDVNVTIPPAPSEPQPAPDVNTTMTVPSPTTNVAPPPTAPATPAPQPAPVTPEVSAPSPDTNAAPEVTPAPVTPETEVPVVPTPGVSPGQ